MPGDHSGEPLAVDTAPPNQFSRRGRIFESVTTVDDWESALAEAGELTPAGVDRVLAAHGDRGQRAIEAVSEERVKAYRDFTVVVGHEDEYVVEDDSCNCADATYNLDDDDPEDLCWHAIAVRIARAIDALDHHDMWYSEVREFL
jgi:predicted nucleic acid-binding Zn finger protein